MPCSPPLCKFFVESSRKWLESNASQAFPLHTPLSSWASITVLQAALESGCRRCGDTGVSVAVPGGNEWYRGNSFISLGQCVTSCITESQNHRMVGVGRDLCGSSSPTLLLKQGHLQQGFLFCFPCKIFPWEGKCLTISSSHPWPPSGRTRHCLLCQFHWLM